MNQRVYVVNGQPTVRVVHQANLYNVRNQANYYAPPPSHFAPYPEQQI